MYKKSKVNKFKRMHNNFLFLPNIWDGGSAKIYEAMGYEALATTSAGIAYTKGLPDGQHLNFSMLYEQVKAILQVINVPLSVDIERGYTEDCKMLSKNVLSLIDLGVCGINIEDGLPEQGAVDASVVFMNKIKTLSELKVEHDIDFVINARLDGKLLSVPDYSIEKIIERGNLALERGADCVFVPGTLSTEELKKLGKHIKGPLNVYLYSGLPDMNELKSYGINRVSSGSAIARETMHHIMATAASKDWCSFLNHDLTYQKANNFFEEK